MKILDMSAGNRAIWFNKNQPDTTYVDIRPQVKPTVVADTTKDLAAAVGTGYTLIVFDPPHVNGGKNSHISRDYGHHTTAQIRRIVQESALQAWWVSEKDAVMSFKWNDHDQKLETMLKLMDPFWEPLVGYKTASRLKHRSSTQWVLLKRRSTYPVHHAVNDL